MSTAGHEGRNDTTAIERRGDWGTVSYKYAPHGHVDALTPQHTLTSFVWCPTAMSHSKQHHKQHHVAKPHRFERPAKQTNFALHRISPQFTATDSTTVCEYAAPERVWYRTVEHVPRPEAFRTERERWLRRSTPWRYVGTLDRTCRARRCSLNDNESKTGGGGHR